MKGSRNPSISENFNSTVKLKFIIREQPNILGAHLYLIIPSVLFLGHITLRKWETPSKLSIEWAEHSQDAIHPVVVGAVEGRDEGHDAGILTVNELDPLEGVGGVMLRIGQVEAGLLPPGLVLFWP